MKKIIKSLVLLLFLFINNTVSAQKLVPCKCDESTKTNPQWSFCDSISGIKKLDCMYSEAHPFNAGLARVKIGNKYGFINSQGVLKIPAEYENAADFSEGVAAVRKTDKYYFIDINNNKKFGKDFYFLSPKILAVANDDLRKRTGIGDPLSSFSDGLAVVYDTSGKAGYIDLRGEWAILPAYYAATAFGNGVALVQENIYKGMTGIDKTGKPLFEVEQGWIPESPFINNTAIVKKGDNRNYKLNLIDLKGKLVFKDSYDEIKRFKNGNFQITNKLHSGYALSTGNIVIHPDTSKYFGALEIDAAGNYWTILYDAAAQNKIGKKVLLNKNFVQVSKGYDHIMPYENGFYLPYNHTSQAQLKLAWGLLSKDGKELLPPVYDYIKISPENKLIYVKDNKDKYGLFDFNFRKVLDIEYNFIDGWDSPAKQRNIIVSKNGLSGIVDKSGKVIVPVKYTGLHLNDDGKNSYYEVSLDKKRGILNIAGLVIIPLVYDFIYDQSEEGCSFFLVSKEGKDGWIDKAGKIILPVKYESGSLGCPGKEGISSAKISDSLYEYVNTSGLVVFGKKFQYATHFYNGIAAVKEKGKYGFINTKGTYLQPETYEMISIVYDNSGDKNIFFIVQKNGKSCFLDKTLKKVTDYIFDPMENDSYFEISEGLVRARQNNKWGFIDLKGNVVIPFVYDEVSGFYEGKANVTLDGESFSIDTKGKKIK